MGTKYMVYESKKDFIRYLVFLTTREYAYFVVSYVPENKLDRINSILDKMSVKYKTNLSKDQFYRNKSKGFANYKIAACDNIIVVMRTPGKPSDDDGFQELNKYPMQIRLGEIITLDIRRRKSTDGKLHHTVSISDRSIFTLKQIYLDLIKRKKINYLISEFGKLNNLPSYAGIIKDKHNLRKFILSNCKKRGIKIDESQLEVSTYLAPYKRKGTAGNNAEPVSDTTR